MVGFLGTSKIQERFNPVEKSEKIPSPCIDKCELTREGYCKGCFRTLEEIANWADMSEEERRSIMKELPARKALIIGKELSGGFTSEPNED